jgi:hypothetical protein
VVSAEKAREDYAEVFAADRQVDEAATQALRVTMRNERGAPSRFDFGAFVESLSMAAA